MSSCNMDIIENQYSDYKSQSKLDLMETDIFP